MGDGGAIQRVVIPYTPRSAFVPFHERHQRFAVGVAHRRAGKTVATLNDLIKHAVSSKKDRPRFAYIAPWLRQAKAVAWDYCKHYTASIPGRAINEAELRNDFEHNDARLQVFGADNYDAMRGLYFDGVVIDEYGDMDPRAWTQVIRPALVDRKGGATFIGTSRGRNHFKDIYEQALREGWFTFMLRASETGLIPADELADARKTMSEEEYDAEFECSFDAPVVGSYYGKLIAAAETAGRIGNVPYDPAVKVETAWDLGIGDSTAIWFCQRVGREVRLIDYCETAGVGLDHYARVLQERQYVYGEHLVPHDAEVGELGTGKKRIEVLASLGIKARVVPKLSVDDGIQAVRNLIPMCWFDREKCSRGLEAVRQYRRKWDEKLKVFHDAPLHDWASHGADAFRYLAVGLREEVQPVKIEVPKFQWQGAWMQ